MDLIYSQSRHPLMDGRQLRNPRFFQGIEEGVKSVVIIGNWPLISAAYGLAGVRVQEIDVTPASRSVALPPPELKRPVPTDERGQVYIPEDWVGLPWSRPTDAGLTLRGLAAVFADGSVLNKTQASVAINEELARRAVLGVITGDGSGQALPPINQ